jgi:hypothetical protein|eukprot:COSAG06_NODE_2793_length_6275_cov_2.145563_3_plen_50_part_00
MGFGIDTGFFAMFLFMLGLFALIAAHLVLFPAAMATDSCVGLMGAINDL